MADPRPLLEVRDLSVSFRSGGRDLRAVEGIDFSLGAGEVMGLVGESGSGKSATAMALLRLLPDAATIGGQILFEGEDLAQVPEKRLNEIRGRDIAMIFQEPMSSLNPVMSIGAQIMEPMRFHLGLSARDARLRAIELLERVRIPAAERRLKNYPHELSGGLRQRVMIAMALSCKPKLLLADEPTTALDVTVQAQILDLLYELKEETGLSIIIITHDLGVVANFADNVAVMYCGRIAETGPVSAFFDRPGHPYTKALIESIPDDDTSGRLATIPGTVPKLTELPPGCRFAPRCAHSRPACSDILADLYQLEPDHRAACIMPFDYRIPDQ